MASAEVVEDISSAFREGRVKVVGGAFNCLTGIWKISVDAFVEAILDHIESNGRVFRKYEKGGSRLLHNKFQASVWIREPDDDDDYDDGTVYVELIVTDNEIILICDTHEHENDGRNPRLPF